MFPTVTPLAPWEATALLSNTGIAAGLHNTAKLDRLTYLETVVANLLLGQPPTLGLAALPAVKAVSADAGTALDITARARDFTGAHFVALTYTEGASRWYGPTTTVSTRSGADMVAEIPHLVPGDAWLVLVTNATDRPLTLQLAAGVRGPDVTIPAGAAQLYLVTVTSLTSVTFTPLLAGLSTPVVVPA